MTTRLLAMLIAAALWLTAGAAGAQTIAPTFDPDYDFVDLGTVPSLPPNAGGLTFLPSDPNTLVIGGRANQSTADVFTIGVTRGAGGHVTGFSGTATFLADANGSTGGIDGGLSFGPGGVLFFTSYSDNRLGQIKPGSAIVDKLVDLNAAAIGVASSVGALAFVPAGFPGAGRLKLAQYSGTGNWYDVTLAPDANGTYDVTGATLKVAIGGGPEGIIYIAAGNAQFAAASILVAEYSNGAISAYEVDANGDPVVATKRLFMSGLSGAEGAVVDPITGDFLFSTFGSSNRVIVVKGFIPPAPALNHFLFYKVKPTKGDLCDDDAPTNAGESCDSEEDCGGTTDVTSLCVPNKHVPKATSAVVPDAFESKHVDVLKTAALGNPADKNGEGISNPAIHLERYQIKLHKTVPPQAKHVPQKNLVVTNQFHPANGALALDTVKPGSLLMQSNTCIDDPAGSCPQPLPAPAGGTHFNCYKVKLNKSTAKFPKGLQASVADQFQDAKLYDVGKPTSLCIPLDDTGAGLGSGATNLVCYKIKLAKTDPKQGKHVKRSAIRVANFLTLERVDTLIEQELCVPSAVVQQ